MRTEGHDVAITQATSVGDSLAVDVRAVRAALVVDRPHAVGVSQFRVTCRDVELRLRIESQITRNVATDGDHRLREFLARTRASSAEYAQFDCHGVWADGAFVFTTDDAVLYTHHVAPASNAINNPSAMSEPRVLRRAET